MCWTSSASAAVRPEGQGGSQRGISDVAGAACGREGGAAYADLASFCLNFPDGSGSGPPTEGAAGSEAAHRSPTQRRPTRLTVMSSPSHRRPRPSGSGTLNVHLDLQTGRVSAIGRLDGRSAPLLYDAVSVLLGTERPNLTLDVSGMEVADNAALRAIGDAYRRAMRKGRRITLRGASPQLRSALTRLHLGHHILYDGAPPTTDEKLTP
jgi:anti-anti-sigma regulatory factor